MQFVGKELFQLHRVGGEAADSVGEFFGGAGVFVQCPAEGGFVEGDFFGGALLGGFLSEFAGEVAFGGLEFLEEVGADGQ